MVVDASVWVSRFVPNDAHHAVAAAWLNRSSGAGDTLVVPTLALPEVGGAVARRTGMAAAGEMTIASLTGWPGLVIVPIDRALAEEAARMAVRLALRGADAVYVATAYARGLPLVTFDDEIHQRATGHVRLIRP
jgi:predicted nucleic acid-binding protein